MNLIKTESVFSDDYIETSVPKYVFIWILTGLYFVMIFICLVIMVIRKDYWVDFITQLNAVSFVWSIRKEIWSIKTAEILFERQDTVKCLFECKSLQNDIALTILSYLY